MEAAVTMISVGKYFEEGKIDVEGFIKRSLAGLS